jgi:hypothetical protein
MNGKNVSKPMIVKNYNTNLYTTNLAVKGHKL